VGVDAMSAVGLYNPINQIIVAVNMLLIGGASILCGEYLGRNESDKMRNTFSLSMIIALLFSLVVTILLLIIGGFDLSGFLTTDPVIRPLLNQYLIGQAILKLRRIPKNMEEFMVIPPDFGVPEEERMDRTILTMDDVVNLSEGVQSFCLERGIDRRRSYFAGLFMEEMAGNVVAHGFHKDKKKHSVDIRVVHKGDNMILRVKDDCVPFDPAERRAIFNPEDATKNIGIRIVYGIADDISHQNILGMNVLTIRV
jgi:anti-sigma regulatory factor (Ser/Thr protein kinase)